MVNYCKSSKCLTGKTAIVTGANAGIGYETALEFAKRGCRVILACRSKEKGTEAKDKIVKATQNSNVVVKLLDLEFFDSVRAFSKDILDNESRLDILVNNAGGIFPDKLTSEGLQLTMVVNYYSHFLLTNLLLDLLQKSAPSRIVNVSSSAARLVYNLNIQDLNASGTQMTLYSRSKLCNIYFTQELAKKLRSTGVTTYSLHPGAIHTEAQRKYSRILDFIASYFFLSPEQGAQTTLYVALEDGIEGNSGDHFENCNRVGPYYSANHPEKAQELWTHSAKVVGLDNSSTK